MSYFGEPIQLKRRRVTRACDRCHKGGTKCAPGPSEDICAPCHAFGAECTFERPMKRRGPPSRKPQVELGELLCENPGKLPKYGPEDWGYKQVASPEVIQKLVEVYYWVVYPIYNYFHMPSFREHIRAEKYAHDRSFYVLTMAMCAVSLARTRNGVKVPSGTPLSVIMAELKALRDVPTSEDFYTAAMKAYPIVLCGKVTIDYMRAAGLLTLMCLEYNDRGGAGCHHHKYLQMANEIGFHDEGRWPPDLTEIEIQERRRLFWCNYRSDIYNACTFGSMVRQRESQTNILFPAEVVDDSQITAEGVLPNPPDDPRPSYHRGGNFVSDMYRLLEHVVDRLRARQGEEKDRSPLVSRLFERSAGPSSAEVLHTVQELYNGLPVEFKVIKEMSGDVTQDHYGYVAVDIIITMMQIKMVLAGSEEHGIPQRCAIAGELLDMLAGVPASFLSASSAPTLHHLAGVGHLLGAIIQSPLSQWKYLQVRSVLLAMVDVVVSIEAGHPVDKGIARTLREHVNRIDSYMNDAADRTKAAGAIAALSGAAKGKRRRESGLPEMNGYGASGSVHPNGHSKGLSASISNGHDPDVTHANGAASASSISQSEAQMGVVNSNGTLKSQDMTSVEALIAMAQPIRSAPPMQYPVPSNTSPSLVNPSTTSFSPTTLFPGTQWSTPEGAETNFQYQLPEDLFAEWPFNFGQENAFDFLTLPNHSDTAHVAGKTNSAVSGGNGYSMLVNGHAEQGA